MPDELLEAVRAEVATALNNRPRRFTSPVAIVALAVALLVPMGGWTMSLSNRVAVLENQTNSLQTAAVEISAMRQEITDFRNEFDEWKRYQIRSDREDAIPDNQRQKIQ
jgi:hypothetical protein